MRTENYSRREFLKTFALISSAPLLVNVLAACSDPVAGAAYGPPPYTQVSVTGIYFLDAQSHTVKLADNQNVPAHTSFTIQFNTAMNMDSVLTAITFVDSGNTPVAFAALAQDERTMGLTPSADLAHNSTYTLSVNNNAVDASGNSRLLVDANATATFKTGV